ncbi:heavy metal translocating P-type ATPase [Chitinispirillales bacterium ANBcel5]|uniref:heavy metal translocating P-type ATPase n=1 Tax=Cellulosispirillum alkaliphilum TaxID=3039283 RepID=UPI002A56ABB6|nr:heavy metal translocating P-type ATPase [Chitinispirillales bacterium ANBcel5]
MGQQRKINGDAGNESAVQRMDLSIEGMSCASCALNIEKELGKVDGVKNASVNFATQKAFVEFRPEKVTSNEIIRQVEKSGYSVGEYGTEDARTLSFKVGGMSCTSCAATVEKTLNAIAGVRNATVNFASERVTISYQPNSVTLSDLKKAVSDAGYTIVEESETEGLKEEPGVLKARKKMVISAALSALMMTMMALHMFVTPIPGYLLLTVLIGLPVVFINGWHVHKAAFNALRRKRPNMDVLVSLGSLPPFLVGLLGFFYPIQTFIEMATTIMTFHLIGKYLETRAKGRASQAIKKLIQMGAKTARIVENGQEREVSTDKLEVGHIMVIRPGEKIPTDGVVVEGSSLVDESMATGESMPVKRKTGQQVIGATINKQGMLKVKVTKVGSETFLSQVIKMVEQCQGSKVPIQEFADRITGYFVPAIIILTGLTFLSFHLFPGFHLAIIQWGATFLPWVNPELSIWTLSFITATAVLVIACPCALGLGTPTALMVGSGMGAERGILIRNGEAVQTLKNIRIIAFDKTGTLTKGKPEVTDIVPADGSDTRELLYYTASVEHASEHPLSQSVLQAASQKGIELGRVENFSAISGMGVHGAVDGKEVLAGNEKLMDHYGIHYSQLTQKLRTLESEAKTVMIVAVDNKPLGLVALADTLKEDSVQAIKSLEKRGIKTAIITGDNERTAAAIARKVGISRVIAGVMPEGKVQEIASLQKEFEMVAMVGDGINDAPAMKQANVGIAIGTGTDIAIEASDVTLVRGELSAVLSAVRLSEEIFSKIKQNFFYAWVYNAIAIPVAMLGLLHPMIGVAAMSMSSLNVVYNSLGLKKKTI